MRFTIERDDVCTSHEATEVNEVSTSERQRGLLFKSETETVGILGTRDEVRALGRQLLNLAGDEVEQPRLEQQSKPEPLSACRIPKTALKRQGFFKPVKTAQVVKRAAARRPSKKSQP